MLESKVYGPTACNGRKKPVEAAIEAGERNPETASRRQDGLNPSMPGYQSSGPATTRNRRSFKVVAIRCSCAL